VSDYRCDALIVESSGLRTLRLSQLYSDIRTRAAELTNPESLSTQLLEWLWDTIAKPVLDAVGLTRSPVVVGHGYGGFLPALSPNFLSTQLGTTPAALIPFWTE